MMTAALKVNNLFNVFVLKVTAIETSNALSLASWQYTDVYSAFTVIN